MALPTLIIESDFFMRGELRALIEEFGLEVHLSPTSEQALSWARESASSLAIVCLEYLVENKTALELRALNPRIIFIVHSGSAQAHATISMIEELGGAVLRDRMITHRELRDLVITLLNAGNSPGVTNTIHRIKPPRGPIGPGIGKAGED